MKLKLVACFGLVGIFVCVVAGALAATGGEPKKDIKPAVQARARAIAVQRGDLPGSGWKAEKPTVSSATPKCSYFNPDQSDLTENADLSSPNFTKRDGTNVSSSVGIFVSAGQAGTAYSRVVRPLLPRCLAELIQKSAKPGMITVRSASALAFPHYGDQSAAFRVVLLVKSGTSQVPAVIDLVALRSSAVVVAVFFGAVGKSLSAATERHVVGRVAARVKS